MLLRTEGYMLWLLGAAVTYAESPVDPFTEPDEADLLRAEQVLTTVASRYAQTVRQAPSIVTVITDEEIRRRGYRTLADVLRSSAGVYISVSSEGRSLGWLRGVTSGDNNKILLLIDGVPFYDGVYTHAWIDEYIPLVHVRQVEIIKGPGSVVYGTNAFAGVINIVTYTAAEVDGGGFARAEAGSFDRRGGAVIAGQRLGEQGAIRTYVRALETDGDGMDRTPDGGYSVPALNPRRAVSAGVDVNLRGVTLRYDHLDYQHTYFVNSQDDLLTVLTESADENSLRYRNDFFSARADLRPTQRLLLSPYGYAQKHTNNGSYGYFGEDALTRTLVDTIKDTERYGAGIQSRLRLGPRHVTIGGLGFELDRVMTLEDRVFLDDTGEPVSPSVFEAEPALIWDSFAFLQHTWTATWWLELTGGLRIDAHNYAGVFPSPRAGALLVTDNGVVKLLYGRAFRAPSARELLVEVISDEDGQNPFTASNPDLLPETIDTLEVEFSGDPNERLSLRGSGYVSQISDEITRATDDSHPTLGSPYYDNGSGAQVAGVEGEASLHLSWLRASGNYTFTQALDTDTGNPVYEFPPHMGHLQTSIAAAPGLWLSALVDLYGQRPRGVWSPDAGLDDGAAFGLLHTAMSTDVLADGRVRLDASIRNLLDSKYQTLIPAEDANALNTDGDARYPRDISGPGRDVVVGVEVIF
ncbi:MAG: outer membrane receptor for ferrienterochelin and colicin [Myxococcota bacterium]|jgi:outer membrane receptor for ferrienterochelin and colicin